MKILRFIICGALVLFLSFCKKDGGPGFDDSDEGETEISTDELPTAVQDYLDQNYKGAPVEEAEKIQKGNSILYEVEILVNGGETELLFDSKGSFLGPEQEKKDGGEATD